MSDSDAPTTYSFPTFHERSTELTAADISRIDIAAATRELIRTSFTSTASTEEIESAKELILQAVEILMMAFLAAFIFSWFLIKLRLQPELLIVPMAILFPFALLSKSGSVLSRGFFYFLLLINFIKIIILP